MAGRQPGNHIQRRGRPRQIGLRLRHLRAIGVAAQRAQHIGGAVQPFFRRAGIGAARRNHVAAQGDIARRQQRQVQQRHDHGGLGVQRLDRAAPLGCAAINAGMGLGGPDLHQRGGGLDGIGEIFQPTRQDRETRQQAGQPQIARAPQQFADLLALAREADRAGIKQPILAAIGGKAGGEIAFGKTAFGLEIIADEILIILGFQIGATGRGIISRVRQPFEFHILSS